MKDKEYKKTVCPLDCPDSCGLIATVIDGKVVALQGDMKHPYTNGVICRKVRRYPQRLYSEHRVLYPQLRIGPKGSGEFKRIGWNQALDICAERLTGVIKEYGGEAILPYSYAGNMGAVNRFAGYPLFHKMGTSQLKHTICSAAASAGWKKHCGDLPGCPPENAAKAEMIIAWGINVKVTNVHFWQYISKARKNGAQLLVIDPYRNQTAQSSDLYIQVKPGGDTALALGILKSLIELNQLDKEFIDQHTQGFGQLHSYLTKCSWDELEQQSGVSKQQMTDLGVLFASKSKIFIRVGVGLTRNSRGGMAVRAITSLAAAMGVFRGGEGCGMLFFTGAFKGNKAALTHPELAEQNTRSINMIHLGHALTKLKPPVKALVVYNSNPLTVNPDASVVRQGFAREDLFTIVHEQVMTPTAYYADLLLPSTTFLENHDVYTSYGQFYLKVAKPVIEPIGEAMSNFDFFQQLAALMAYDDPPFKQTCKQRIRAYLSDMEGIPEIMDIENIMDGELVHSTRSFQDGNALIEKRGKYQFVADDQSDMPSIACLTSPHEFNDPDLLSRFPFQLITPPHLDLLNSTFGELHLETIGKVLIHPNDARQCEVRDGEEVILVNHRGKVRRKAQVTTDTRQGVLVAEGLYWPVLPKRHDGLVENGINDLTSQKLSDMGGGATFHESLVTIQRSAMD